MFLCVVRRLARESFSVRVSVPSLKPYFLVDWIFLVEECIANIAIPLHVSFVVAVLRIFCVLKLFQFFVVVFAEHSGGVSITTSGCVNFLGWCKFIAPNIRCLAVNSYLVAFSRSF